MLYNVLILIYLLVVGVFVIKQQLILLGGYVLAREKEGIAIADKLVLDSFINSGTKGVWMSILFLLGSLIIVALRLF